MTESIRFQFAIYYLPRPTKDLFGSLTKMVNEKYDELTVVDPMPETPNALLVHASTQYDVKKEYAPPDMESLRYFGRGITLEQAQRLQSSEQAFVLDFGYPKDTVWIGLRIATEVVEAIARETGGVLWDEQTREVFSPDEWHRRRIASWTEEIPDISNQTSVHVYNKGEYVRAITLGMSKVGLPDVVVEEFSWSMNRTMGHLINLFCQAMAEGGAPSKPGKFDLDLRAIRNPKVRDPQVESLKPNAMGVAYLSLRKGTWEEGDPFNRLIELGFDRYSGRDVHAKQEEMLSSLFGWEDSVTPVDHGDELLAASRLARAQLPALRDAFTAGLRPGEFIQVKAPFETPDGGREWMWVEVTAWRGRRIKGLLKNEPFNIPSLHGGQIVEVTQEDVFDYIRRYPDGTQEGNETGALIQKKQQEKAREGIQ